MYNQKSSLEEVNTTLVSEDLGDKIKVVDSQNNFYTFFKNKQDGTPSKAFTTWQKFKEGDLVLIKFSSKPGSQGGVFRNVAWFEQGNGEVQETHTPPPYFKNPYQKPATPTNVGSFPANVDKSTFIEAQAIAKSLLESNQATPADIINQEWWATVVFPAISAMHAVAAEQEINVEDIPF